MLGEASFHAEAPQSRPSVVVTQYNYEPVQL